MVYRFARHPSRILEPLTGIGLPGHVDRVLAMARYPYQVTGPFAYTFSFVLIVASRPQQVSRHVIGNSSTQRIPAGATASEVNAAKNACVRDFRDGLGKIRIGTSTWTYLGGDAEGGVFSKEVSKDERRSPTEAGMRRRIFGM